ncbi:hypothetical protein J4207_00780 [Candidatus Woesearchaeota archaeon]|nr:hypothetical protein [Candidatus Woesearchaeota archaeon]HLC80387.1 hypothetical protein [Candidatus Nanoarchaeia archaeon]
MNILKKTVKTFGAVLALYAIIESAAVVTNFVPKVELELNREELEKNYVGRHKLYYEIFQPDKTLGYKLKPNLDNWVHVCDKYQCIIMATDELGLRSWLDDKKSAEIVFVGGTTSFGGSAKQITFPYRLQESGVDVSNFSVPGYLPWQMNETMIRFPQFFMGKTILYCLSPKSFEEKKLKDAGDYYHFKKWNKYEYPEPVDADLIDAHQSVLEKTIIFWAYRALTEDSSMKDTWKSVLSSPERMKKEVISESIDPLFNDFGEAVELARQYHSDLKVILFPSKSSSVTEEYATKVKGGEAQVKTEEQTFKLVFDYFYIKGVDVLDLTNPLREFYHTFGEYRGVGVFNRSRDIWIAEKIKGFLKNKERSKRSTKK